MPREKEASKRKRVTKAAVRALGAATLTFGLAGGASASTTPTADAPQKFTPTQTITLSEEEIADVSLATFHLFDKENAQGGFVQEARGCGCGGCRGCGCRGCGCRGCRGCGCRGCGGCGCGGFGFGGFCGC